MIFLAVTMGFFARQIRERHMEKERLQNYFGSMVLDIESNRMALDSAIRLNTNMIRDYDAMARSFLTGGPSFDRAAFARQMGSIWCR